MKKINTIKEEANQGCIDAQFFLSGYFKEKDAEEALYWLKLAAEGMHAEASYKLTLHYYETGDLVNASTWAALSINSSEKAKRLQNKIVREIDESSMNESMMKAAKLVEKITKRMIMRTVTHRPSKAVKELDCTIEELKKLAKEGSAEHQFHLGLEYERGKRVEKDKKKAKFWYTKAAKQGYAKAQFNLSNIYEKEDNFKKSVEWLEKACEQDDHKEGCFNVAIRYHQGEGVEKNIEKAIYWYNKAIELGEPASVGNLGTLYSTDSEFKDYNKAAECFEKLLEIDEVTACLNLGIIYSKEKLNDIPKSLYYYKKGSELGCKKCNFNLGITYERGEGVTANISVAKKYFSLNGIRNCNLSNNKLGKIMLKEAENAKTEKERVEARQKAILFFEKAARNGYFNAQKEVLRFHLDERNNEQALIWIYVMILCKQLNKSEEESACNKFLEGTTREQRDVAKTKAEIIYEKIKKSGKM